MSEHDGNIYPLTPRQDEPRLEPVVIAEMSADELYTKTDVVDLETGKALTVLELMRRDEHEQHGGRIFTHIGDKLSEGAKKANSLLSRRNVRAGGAFVMAVVAMRLVKRHLDHESE